MSQGSLSPIQERRERVFLVLAAFFLCAMTLLNVVGITKFIQLGPFALAIGVLPYPLTFLCTDLVCELYGKARANFLVFLGLIMNAFVLIIMYLGQWLPSVPAQQQPPWQKVNLAAEVALANGISVSESVDLFYLIYTCTTGAVMASMVAYMTAQFVDVQLFHFWKRVTRGRHLWLRNNLSTVFSQLIDSIAVISITFGAAFLDGKMEWAILMTLLWSNYLFKLASALVDTGPFYVLVSYLKKYLQLDEGKTCSDA